jgi:bacteriophage N4 adsorption protein B
MNSWVEFLRLSLIFGFLVLCGVYLMVGTEDFILDLTALVFKLKPKKVTAAEWVHWNERPEKAIAILVPAWKEGGIIGKMLQGNLSQIQYKNVFVFVGCYPNDPETLSEVEAFARFNPKVIPVVNDLPGPTSKGQMLNCILDFIRHRPEEFHLDAFLLQDSEDLIDPYALKLINWELDKNDFVQIPVFSLEVQPTQLIAGSYIDEFAESHTKDLLVREFLGAAIPSAGVGTAFSAKLADTLYESLGWVFYENSLTEDYELGVRSHLMGFKGTFACRFFEAENGRRSHLIATREYFPKKWTRSIRQKTRWTIGIAIQGWRNLGWKGSFIHQYYLWRDRRGVFTNILVLAGYPFSLLLSYRLFSQNQFHGRGASGTVEILFLFLILNLFFMFNRFLQRVFCVYRVYGLSALWSLPLRWPIAVMINALACLNALNQTLLHRVRKTRFQWVKTDHELPEGFGNSVAIGMGIGSRPTERKQA